MAWAVSIVWAAGAAATATEVFAAIAAVGMVSTVVGAVTGNKDLIKFGQVAGLVGGIGMAASAAGLIGEEAIAAGSAEAGGAMGATNTASAFATPAAAPGSAASMLTGAAPEVTGAAASLGTAPTLAAAPQLAGEAANSSVGQLLNAGGGTTPMGGAAMDIGSGGVGIDNTALSTNPGKDPSWWSTLESNTQGNIALAAGKLGGEMLSGLSSGANARRQLDFTQQQADLNRAGLNAQPTNITGLTYNPNALPFSPAPVDPRRFITGGTGMIAPQPATPAGR